MNSLGGNQFEKGMRTLFLIILIILLQAPKQVFNGLFKHGQAPRAQPIVRQAGDKSRMKYQCIKTDNCSVCGNKGTIQAFLNSANSIRYARTRHHLNGKWSYCRLRNLREVEALLKAKPLRDQEQTGQGQAKNNRSSNHLNSSLKPEIILWASSSVRTEHQPPKLGVEGSNPSPPASNNSALTTRTILACHLQF